MLFIAYAQKALTRGTPICFSFHFIFCIFKGNEEAGGIVESDILTNQYNKENLIKGSNLPFIER